MELKRCKSDKLFYSISAVLHFKFANSRYEKAANYVHSRFLCYRHSLDDSLRKLRGFENKTCVCLAKDLKLLADKYSTVVSDRNFQKRANAQRTNVHIHTNVPFLINEFPLREFLWPPTQSKHSAHSHIRLSTLFNSFT